jgi:hypothetical protein
MHEIVFLDQLEHYTTWRRVTAAVSGWKRCGPSTYISADLIDAFKGAKHLFRY